MTAEIDRMHWPIERITHPNPHVLRAEVTRMARRGEVRQVTMVMFDDHGHAVVSVERLRAPRPRWIVPTLVGLPLALTLAGLIWVGIMALVSVLPMILGGAAVLLLAALLIRSLFGGGGSGHSGYGFHWTKC